MITPIKPRPTAVQRLAFIFSLKNRIENITTQIGPENAIEVTSASSKFRSPTKMAYIPIVPTPALKQCNFTRFVL